MRTVYGMGLFDDVTAELFDTTAGRELRFTVREKPVVRRVTLRGSDKVKEETILEVLSLKSNAILDYVTLNEDVERIKKLYEGEGFYLATVDPEVIVEDGGASIAYVIEEGEKVQVKSITIIGNEAIADKKLKKSMKTRVLGFFSFITGSGSFNEFVFRNDLAVIINKYLNIGYLQADITDQRVLLSEDKRWFHITITISEGDQFTLGEFDISGDILGTKEELLAKFELERGAVFNRSLVTKGIESIRDVYGDQGYAFAAFSPISNLDQEKKSVDIMLEISKNELAYIERIDITGNVKTRDKVIRREIEVVEGDLYSSSGIKRSRGNLKRLGYFEDATIARSQGSAPDKLKLNVTVKEVPTGAFSLGVGYSSFDKLIGTGSVSQSNLFGTGIKASISAMLSSSSTRYTLSFTEPWLFDKPLSAGIDIFNVEREYADFTIDEKGFGLRFGFPIHKRTTRGNLSYKLEEVDVTDVEPNASIVIRDQEGLRTVSSILASIRRDTRDDAFFPTEGSNASFSAKYAGGPLGGDTDFVKFDTEGVKYFPLPWKHMSIAQRLAIGYITGLSGQDEPIYERYFLGGINSLRGFESRSVGPRDPVTDEIIGGNIMFFANTEFLFPILSQRTLRGVVFFDIGNSFEDDLDFGDLRMGAGAGVRWFSPIGPLRIELGFNLDRREDEEARLWEFTVGSAF
jgi:outer membrane protein insertion porin family